MVLRHTMDSLELEFAQVAVDFEASNEWKLDGFNTPYDWIRFNCHMTSGQVINSFAVGEQMPRLAHSLEARRDWKIGFAHLAFMARTANQVGKAFEESKLLPLAIKHSAGKFFDRCRHYVHAVDASGYNRNQEDLVERRSLRMSTAEDGCLVLSGAFDPVSGAAIRNAVQPLLKPSGDQDHRDLGQRTADAFYEILTRGQRVQLQVTASAQTLLARAGAPGGEMEFSLPLSSATVERMACDCSLSRILLDQESLVVDVGRAKPVISATLRKALSIRDGHCRWPGCERPASWCDGHHIVYWTRGGETNLGNLVLLCRRHHRMVHEGGWQLVKSGDRYMAIAPTIMFGYARGPDSSG